jgi:5-methyltetrahydropteroyltriglutamate--homocysteine methyltransferase
MSDFIAGLDGIATEEPPIGPGQPPSPYPVLKVTGKVGFTIHPIIEHFNFVKARTNVAPKMCIPSPTHIVTILRDWRETVDQKIYPNLDALFADAGCKYLQIDDCNFSFLCDPAVRDTLKKRGDDPEAMLKGFVALINAAVRDRPAGISITMHSCRGNTGRGFASGGYEPVAEAIFGGIDVDGFFLEFDDERAGGFEPLRHLSGDKAAALGLISTKRKTLEAVDDIKRRVDEAAKFVDFDRLSLSPQCGFASSQGVDRLTEDEQWAKLDHVVSLAGRIWAN